MKSKDSSIPQITPMEATEKLLHDFDDISFDMAKTQDRARRLIYRVIRGTEELDDRSCLEKEEIERQFELRRLPQKLRSHHRFSVLFDKIRPSD